MPGYDETRTCRAQSTIEYILAVAAVIMIILVFLSRNGIFQNALNATYDSNINSMLNMAERILQ